MESNNGSATLVLKDCTVLGSSGFPFSSGETIAVAFNNNTVNCRSSNHLAKFSLLELAEISITGPGTVVTGGGFIGGGFGIEEAAEAQRLLDEKMYSTGPMGLCPNCEKTIQLHSETCRYCKANFGQYSSWQVIPIG
ncbi:hypothetical protein H0A66_02110 [Alcaligenaceae bacterium]|nr:hypothetical protein [Alcaligenaceae bacterium]